MNRRCCNQGYRQADLVGADSRTARVAASVTTRVVPSPSPAIGDPSADRRIAGRPGGIFRSEGPAGVQGNSDHQQIALQ